MWAALRLEGHRGVSLVQVTVRCAMSCFQSSCGSQILKFVFFSSSLGKFTKINNDM